MTKRVLRRIRLDKIAGVDRPCQQHATIAIVKRSFTPEQRQALADKGHAMKDGSYPISTLGDLHNAISSFGRAKNQAAVKAHIISRARALGAVNVLPPSWGIKKELEAGFLAAEFSKAMVSDRVAKAAVEALEALAVEDPGFAAGLTDADPTVITKLVDCAVAAARDAGISATDAELNKSITEAATSWLAENVAQPKEHTMKITNKAQLLAAVSAFDPETTPVAHVGIIKQAAKDLKLEGELPAEGPLAVEKSKDDDPKLAKALREIEELKMPEDVRKHYDGLADDAAKTAFLAKSADDRKAEVDAANATDPVVYKTAKGIEIRKSDGAAALALAKQSDEDRAELAKLRNERNTDSFEKRAASEFPNVAKSVAVEMLTSADQVGEDSDAGKAVIKTLKSMNSAGGKLFKQIGTTDAGADGEAGGLKKARADFNVLVEKVAKDLNLGQADAMSKARELHPDEYALAYPAPDEEEDA